METFLIFVFGFACVFLVTLLPEYIIKRIREKKENKKDKNYFDFDFNEDDINLY